MSTPADIDLSEGAGAFGVLAFTGPDAGRFLQGQLSADTEKLAPGAGTLAGLHNPQGRTVALLALTRAGVDQILAALPAELLEPVAQRLRKYVLRAKVRIEDLSSSMRVIGAAAGPRDAAIPQVDWGDRRLLLIPKERLPPVLRGSRAKWQRDDVRQGLPQVYVATSEQFVAQMLNLDLLGAIAFDKGCYTGQEVIARAHYRGRVKRRMQRWLNGSGTELRPGDVAHGPDGRALTVVCGASSESAQEILAVGSFAVGGQPAAEIASPARGDGIEVAGPLPLPYPLPE
jgi:tRNA-modifying protein YgfZ